MSPIFIVSQTALVIISAFAFWRGRTWERLTAGVLLLNWLGTELGPDFNRVDPPWFGIVLDGLVCLFMIYAALFSGRKWTLWAAAFQLLLMANHLAFIRYHLLDQWPYITAYYVWGDLLLIALLTGVIFPDRATGRVADDPGIQDAGGSNHANRASFHVDRMGRTEDSP